MGLFGSEETVYLKYSIYLTDKARVLALQEVDPLVVGGVQRVANMAPQQASVLYAAPLQNSNVPNVAPCTRSEYIKPLPTPNTNFPYDLVAFDASSGGFLGFGGHTIHYRWRGYFVYAPPTGSQTSLPVTPVASRRWLDGFETIEPGGLCSRAASRHSGGYGLKLDNTATTSRTHAPTENYIPSASDTRKQQWERFYFRVRVLPVGGKSRIWRVRGLSSNNAGAAIDVLPDGTLIISLINASNVEFQLGIGSKKIVANVWHKLDLVYAFKLTGDPQEYSVPGGFVNCYVDGTLAMGTVDTAFTYLTNQEIGTSELGGGPANGFCWDADDWFGAEVPTCDLYLTFPFKIGSNAGDHRFCGQDWNNGTQIKLVGADGFGSDNSGTWVGDWRLTRQNPVGDNPQQLLTVAGSQIRLTLKTDASRTLDTELGSLGMTAIMVAAYQKRAAGADGKLGFRLTGLTQVTSIVQFTALQWNRILYTFQLYGPVLSVASGGPLAGLELIHDSGLNGSLQTLLAEVELTGVFGPEDVVIQPTDQVQVPIPVAPAIGLHNAPYPESPWARKGFSPVNPIVIVAGTYTGNGTFQDLRFKAPVHLFWTRPLTGGAGGFQWWSAMNAAHQGGGESHWPDGVLQALADPTFVAANDSAYAGDPATLPAPPGTVQAAVDLANQLAYGYAKHTVAYWTGLGYLSDPAYYFGRMLGNGAGGADIAKFGLYAVPPSPWNTIPAQQSYLVRLAGANANSNANAVVYQYLAICDPGERFFSSGALKVYNQTGDIVETLDDETFLPEACFVQHERNGASLTVRTFYKGVGHAAAAITQFQGTQVATGLKFGVGSLTSSAGLMYASATQIPYFVARRNDGSQDPGLPRVLALSSYTGDGSASRTVGLAPASGRYPLWAMVVSHQAGSLPIYRDPSHTGTTSTVFPATASASTGITGGGIDTISVGSALNVVGVVYDVFVIPGDVIAGNAGFSINGEFIPVDPTGGTGTQFDPSPASPEDNNAPADGGTGPTVPPGGDGSGIGGGGSLGASDLTGTCAVSSLQVINTALSHLGVSKRVINILTDLTQEADTARLHYQDDVDATLRDFPWPFATRYADLVLVAGTATVPVNGDWQYAYRTPANFLFARRIVNPSGARRQWDATPVPFRLGSDDTGTLIYSNAINSDQLTLTLEYTIRIACAATAGDAIFRSALSWRHAHSLAPALSRDEKKGAYCWQMYKAVVVTAATMGSAEQQQEPPGGPDWLEGRDGTPDWLRYRQ